MVTQVTADLDAGKNYLPERGAEALMVFGDLASLSPAIVIFGGGNEVW